MAHNRPKKSSAVPTKLARMATLFGARIQRLPRDLGNHPGLLFSPRLEAYSDYTFGCRSGPSVQVRHLFHELGHAAQFGGAQFAERARLNGFVFKVRQVEIGSKFYDEPSTSQATDRELDTFAHELHLMQAAGLKCHIPDHLDYCASIMRHMPDWWAIPGESGSERKQECVSRIRNFYDQLTQAEVLDKLTSWLDATGGRLSNGTDRPYHQVEFRFRADGSLYLG